MNIEQYPLYTIITKNKDAQEIMCYTFPENHACTVSVQYFSNDTFGAERKSVNLQDLIAAYEASRGNK